MSGVRYLQLLILVAVIMKIVVVLLVLLSAVRVKAEVDNLTISRLAGGEDTPILVPMLTLIKPHVDEYDLSEEDKTCSGAIIAPNMVLTTASCVLGADSAEVIAGSLNSEVKVENNNGIQIVNSSSIVVHPKFFSNTLENDIAIIKVNPVFNFSDTSQVAPIPLPRAFWVHKDTMAGKVKIAVVGWGASSKGSCKVMQAIRDMSVTKQRDCEAKLKQTDGFKLPSSAFCVNVSGENGICEHDEGSLALALLGRKRTFSLVGLGSTHVGDTCPSSLPNVFTRVGNFLRWIVDNGGPKPPR